MTEVFVEQPLSSPGSAKNLVTIIGSSLGSPFMPLYLTNQPRSLSRPAELVLAEMLICPFLTSILSEFES